MKNLQELKAATVAALALTAMGCTDVTSPEGVLAVFYQGVTTQNLMRIQLVTTGDATVYGTEEAMQNVRKELEGLEVELGKRTLLWSEEGIRTDKNNYSVEILARRDAKAPFTHLKTATVFCRTHYRWVMPQPMPEMPRPGRETPITRCHITSFQ